MAINDIYISPSDFSCVGAVTKSCNYDKLCTAIERALLFDVEPLLCYDFMSVILEKWALILAIPSGDPIPPELLSYNSLIFGGEYITCKGKKARHLGVKKLWIYYAYGWYVLINPQDDTPNGLTYKTNEFSTSVPIKDLTVTSNTYRSMAIEIYKNIKEYLCLNKDLFTNFDSCDCHLDCGCTGACGCGGTKKITGFRYKTIRK